MPDTCFAWGVSRAYSRAEKPDLHELPVAVLSAVLLRTRPVSSPQPLPWSVGAASQAGVAEILADELQSGMSWLCTQHEAGAVRESSTSHTEVMLCRFVEGAVGVAPQLLRQLVYMKVGARG